MQSWCNSLKLIGFAEIEDETFHVQSFGKGTPHCEGAKGLDMPTEVTVGKKIIYIANLVLC